MPSSRWGLCFHSFVETFSFVRLRVVGCDCCTAGRKACEVWGSEVKWSNRVISDQTTSAPVPLQVFSLALLYNVGLTVGNYQYLIQVGVSWFMLVQWLCRSQAVKVSEVCRGFQRRKVGQLLTPPHSAPVTLTPPQDLFHTTVLGACMALTEPYVELGRERPLSRVLTVGVILPVLAQVGAGCSWGLKSGRQAERGCLCLC